MKPMTDMMLFTIYWKGSDLRMYCRSSLTSGDTIRIPHGNTKMTIKRIDVKTREIWV